VIPFAAEVGPPPAGDPPELPVAMQLALGIPVFATILFFLLRWWRPEPPKP
jgi:hypothetical protein